MMDCIIPVPPLSPLSEGYYIQLLCFISIPEVPTDVTLKVHHLPITIQISWLFGQYNYSSKKYTFVCLETSTLEVGIGARTLVCGVSPVVRSQF